MLKKLLSHEWNDTWRLVGILNLIVIGMTLIGSIFLSNEAWRELEGNTFVSVVSVSYMMFYIVSISALQMVVNFYFYIRFYRNLYTDQGYLMHTLPVTSHELIWSKAVVAFVWSVISSFVSILSVFTLIFSALAKEERAEFWSELFSEMSMIQGEWRVVVFIIEIILLVIASSLMSMFMGYASISIGQTFKKQKVLGSIGVYIGIYMLMQIVSSYAAIMMTSVDLYRLESTMGTDNIMIIFMFLCLLVVAAVAAGFYLITNYIMKNSLNLE